MPAGSWDYPGDGSAVAPGALVLGGWAAAAGGARPARVTVRVHGSLVGETLANLPRPDVAEIIGPSHLRSGWSMQVTVPEITGSYELEVIASLDNREWSLGQRSFHVDARAPSLAGAIDQPLEGQEIAGQVIALAGWTLPGRDIADTIEVFVDDDPPVRVRRCAARLDVAAAGLADGGVGVAAGFTEFLPVRRTARPSELTLVVRARGRNGATWHSRPVTVSLVEEAPDSHQRPLPETPIRPEPTGRSPRHDRPRVCAFTHSLALGGGQLYLQELLLRLAAKDIAELIVISPSDGPLRDELEAAGIGVHVTAPYPVEPDSYTGRVSELASLLAGWGTDLVIANTLGAFPAVDAALIVGLPTAWAIHESFDLDVYEYLNWPPHGLHPGVRDRLVSALACADLAVFESDATLRMYSEAVPELTGRCIRYGIDLEAVSSYVADHGRHQLRSELGFDATTKVLLCMGVMEARKGQLALIEAFGMIADADPDARLVLVGDHEGEYAVAARQLIAEMGLDESVRTIPIDPDTYRWYHCADVLVSASDTESLPRSILEAMAFGVPVLAADVFGVSEVIVDGVNGWLCDSRDGEALLAGLRRVLACDEDELAQMAERCREDAKSFDGDGYANAFAAMIRALPVRPGVT